MIRISNQELITATTDINSDDITLSKIYIESFVQEW